jgi:2-polyprenyl-6-methoxyphenol hydroxylase-like FAD-dependent oxidoreductase
MDKAGGHAVVIGAGIGGVVAARVLADRFDEVTILERDGLPSEAIPRKGVPHGRHAHGLLARGREALEELFPGLTEELVAAGAVPGDILAESSWFNHGVYLASGPSGLEGILMSRPMLEAHVRRKLLRDVRVRALEGVRVNGLVADEGNHRVVGVRLAEPLPGEDEAMLRADLVVDSSGRNAQSREWLEALGYAKPAEETIGVDIAYTTRMLRRRPGQLRGKKVVLIAADAPLWRFGVALAIENDRWIVTLGGYFGDMPATNERAYLDFARTLPAADVADLLEAAEPISDFACFRFPASRRFHYESLDRFPEGFVVFADALCSFNPVYGQGMTTAAVEGLALRDCLAEVGSGLGRRFFAKAGTIIDTPWQIAAGSDLRHPRLGRNQSRFNRFLNWYLGKLHKAAARDTELARSFLRVANLMAPPATLLAPTTMLRVMCGNLRGGHRFMHAQPQRAKPVASRSVPGYRT